jgi:hypothetical protein
MKTEDALDVSAYLTDIEIEHEIESIGILVDRDSICSKISGKTENDSYENLKKILGRHFNARFHYTSRTDDWLMLEKIGDEE